jgi:transposase
MEQRAVIRFLTLKGLDPQTIFTELTSVYHDDVPALPTIYKWHARFCNGRTDLSDDPRSGRPKKSDLADAIASMLQERPFVSCKIIARHFRVAKSTCLQILHNDLGMKKFHLQWVPHHLDPIQKQNRVSTSSQLLTLLQAEAEEEFAHVITGDESWFFLHYSHDSMWAESADQLPVRVKQTIDTEKCLISILWSVNGIHSLLDIPKGESYNSAFFCNAVIPSLVENICSQSRRKSLRGLYLHLDNARPHNSRESNECLKATKAKRIIHPAYSPDLAPSDFFLFGFLKQEIQGLILPDRESLKSAIIEIFSKIDRNMLISAFQDWMTRLQWVITNKGEYYNK